MINKKAQGEIITTILIILLVLAAIVIVWQVVNKSIIKSSEQIDINPILLKGELKYSIDSGGSNMQVEVKRGLGGGVIKGVKILFQTTSGDVYSFTGEALDELETENYEISLSDLEPEYSGNFNDVERVSLYYIYEGKTGEGVTNELSSSTSPEKGELFESTCNTEIDVDDDTYNPGAGCENRDCDDYNEFIFPGNSNTYCDCNVEDGYDKGTETETNCFDGIDTDCDGSVDDYDCLTSAGNINLVGYWKFEGDFADSSNKGYDGVGEGEVGFDGSALSLDGVNDYVTTSYNGNPSTYVGSAWVKLNPVADDAADYAVMSVKHDGSYVEPGHFAITIVDGKVWGYARYKLGDWYRKVQGTININDNTWHHVLVISSETLGKTHLYVDGVEDGSNIDYYSKQSTVTPMGLWIGAYYQLGVKMPFNGLIDEVMVFDTDLTGDQIQEIYNTQKTSHL